MRIRLRRGEAGEKGRRKPSAVQIRRARIVGNDAEKRRKERETMKRTTNEERNCREIFLDRLMRGYYDAKPTLSSFYICGGALHVNGGADYDYNGGLYYEAILKGTKNAELLAELCEMYGADPKKSSIRGRGRYKIAILPF